MGVNGEAFQLHAVYKKPYFLLQVTRESVSVLQVTRESVSGTTSHMRCVWTCNEIRGSYDKIIITIVPSYTGKNITRLLPLALRTRNNTDGNKLVIFSGIAWYYGDTYIVISACIVCRWSTWWETKIQRIGALRKQSIQLAHACLTLHQYFNFHPSKSGGSTALPAPMVACPNTREVGVIADVSITEQVLREISKFPEILGKLSMRKQCVPGSFRPTHAWEPGNEAILRAE